MFVSIYNSCEEQFVNFETAVIDSTREKNKETIIKLVEEKLLEIL